jgi:urease accessory protein
MRPVSWRLVRRLPLLLCLFALPATAHAHSPVKGLGDFYNGLLHPLTTPSHVLILIALGLLAGRRRPPTLKAPMTVFLVVSAAALVAATMGGVKNLPSVLPLGVALAAGILLALDTNPPALPFCALCGAGALVLGLDSAVESASRAGVVKTLLGNWISLGVLVCDIALYVSMGGDARWLKVALRVAGSWLIAISLLMLAFSLRPS